MSNDERYGPNPSAAAPFDIDHDQDLRDGDDPRHELDDHDQPTTQVRSRLRGRQPADAQDLLGRVASIISASRPMPMSTTVRVNKDEVMELLEEAIERLPDELREARWLRKERDEYLAKMRVDGDEILDAARAHAERLVQRTEVVKAAEHRARRIVEAAEAEARRLRLECEDFCDQKLAGFEIVLERTLKLVSQGRQKLQATNITHGDDDATAAAAEHYFDQPRHD